MAYLYVIPFGSCFRVMVYLYVIPFGSIYRSFVVLRPIREYLAHTVTSQLLGRAEIFRPMIGTYSLWAGRDLYRAIPAVTLGPRPLRFHPIDRPPPIHRQGPLKTYSNCDPIRTPSFVDHWILYCCLLPIYIYHVLDVVHQRVLLLYHRLLNFFQ